MNTKLPVIITLSNESDFSIDNHLQSLIVNKHISSFQLFGERDECLRRLVIVLVDGAAHNVNFRFNGKRLAQLEQFDFCEVDECDGGFWIEFSAEDVETYHN